MIVEIVCKTLPGNLNPTITSRQFTCMNLTTRKALKNHTGRKGMAPGRIRGVAGKAIRWTCIQ